MRFRFQVKQDVNQNLIHVYRQKVQYVNIIDAAAAAAADVERYVVAPHLDSITPLLPRTAVALLPLLLPPPQQPEMRRNHRNS